MEQKVDYYLALLSSLCGFDSPEDVSLGGIVMIFIALAVLVFSVYKMVTYTLWPEDKSKEHIKYSVLNEEGGYEN